MIGTSVHRVEQEDGALSVIAAEIIADPAARGTSDIAGAHRGGSHRIVPLYSGDPDDPGNYEFSLYTVSEGYHTPRHRHHYDQVRYVLSGSLSIGSDVWLNPRQLGWFPAGTSYGPQHNDLPATALILQIGGPDGQGFPPYDRLPAAKAALAERGVFDNGTYRDTDPDGNARNRDAMLAVETEISGREPFLPPPRYSAPVLMNVDSFQWRPTPTAGVRSKHFGTFGEGRLAIEFVSIDERATGLREPQALTVLSSSKAAESRRHAMRCRLAVRSERLATSTSRFMQSPTLFCSCSHFRTLTVSDHRASAHIDDTGLARSTKGDPVSRFARFTTSGETVRSAVQRDALLPRQTGFHYVELQPTELKRRGEFATWRPICVRSGLLQIRCP